MRLEKVPEKFVDILLLEDSPASVNMMVHDSEEAVDLVQLHEAAKVKYANP